MSRRKKNKRHTDPEKSLRPTHLSEQKDKIKNAVFMWFVIILSGAIFGYAFVTFGFQTVTVIGPSMKNTLDDGQVVVVNKLTYTIGDIDRYDVVAYSQVETDTYFDIKRVIGLPNETVQIKDGLIYIDNKPLTDCPIKEQILNSGMASEEIHLGDTEYFVLGDNINNSEDSRYSNIGNIGESEMLGKVVFILSPGDDRGIVR